MYLWFKGALTITLLGSAAIFILLGATNAGIITLAPQGTGFVPWLLMMVLAWPFMLATITLGLQLFGINGEYTSSIMIAAIVINVLWLFMIGAIIGWIIQKLKKN